MTCIIGLAHEGTVWIGGDSAGIAGWSRTIRADRKVFTKSPFVMGFTTSFRMGDLLRYHLTVAKQGIDQPVEEFMVTYFVAAARQAMRDGGYLRTAEGREQGGQFLVGYAGRLFQIDSDFQVGEPVDGIATLGCGDDIAMGAMDALADWAPEDRIRRALEITAHRSAGVAPPFTILSHR